MSKHGDVASDHLAFPHCKSEVGQCLSEDMKKMMPVLETLTRITYHLTFEQRLKFNLAVKPLYTRGSQTAKSNESKTD